MKREKITRKKFLSNVSAWSLTTAVGGGLLSACSGPSGQSEQITESTVPPPVDEEEGAAPDVEPLGDATESCDDLTGLTELEIRQREQLQYVAESPKEDQICANCRFWQPDQQEGACGGCQLIKGPIHPNGWCQTWAPMQT